jgi:hypothetical protein
VDAAVETRGFVCCFNFDADRVFLLLLLFLLPEAIASPVSLTLLVVAASAPSSALFGVPAEAGDNGCEWGEGDGIDDAFSRFDDCGVLTGDSMSTLPLDSSAFNLALAFVLNFDLDCDAEEASSFISAGVEGLLFSGVPTAAAAFSNDFFSFSADFSALFSSINAFISCCNSGGSNLRKSGSSAANSTECAQPAFVPNRCRNMSPTSS